MEGPDHRQRVGIIPSLNVVVGLLGFFLVKSWTGFLGVKSWTGRDYPSLPCRRTTSTKPASLPCYGLACSSKPNYFCSALH
ncbi:hypothetical protein FF1_012609 [Malus domestica]